LPTSNLGRDELSCQYAAGAEIYLILGEVRLDLLLVKDGRKYGMECKRIDAPRVTSSMKIALQDLDLEHLFVLYPGEKMYKLSDRITAMPLRDLAAAAGMEIFQD
jgi:hypothetical protein